MTDNAINFNNLPSSDDYEAITCAVLKEHTLGYIYRLGKSFYFSIIYGKGTLGGLDWKLGSIHLVSSEYKHVRKATKKDFNFFNVMSTGYEVNGLLG